MKSYVYKNYLVRVDKRDCTECQNKCYEANIYYKHKDGYIDAIDNTGGYDTVESALDGAREVINVHH